MAIVGAIFSIITLNLVYFLIIRKIHDQTETNTPKPLVQMIGWDVIETFSGSPPGHDGPSSPPGHDGLLSSSPMFFNSSITGDNEFVLSF